MRTFLRAVSASLMTLLFLLGRAEYAAAQPQVNGPAGVDIFVIATKPKVRAATTGTNGRATLPADLVAPGTELQVVVARCGGQMSIVLTERGRTDPDCDNQQPGGATPGAQQQPRCSCDPTGLYIVWGRPAVINVTAGGQVRIDGGSQTGTTGGGGAIGFIADIDVARVSLSDTDTICDDFLDEFGGQTSCDVDGTGVGFSADVGVTFARFFAAKVGFLSLGEVTIDVDVPIQQGVSITADGTLGSTRGVTFVGAIRVPLGPVVVFGEGGVWRWSSSSSSQLALRVDNQVVESDSFSSDFSGVDPIFGGGVEFWFTPRLGVSGGVRVAKASGEPDNDEEGPLDESFTVVFVGLKLGWN
jgi:hypothetical protein